MTHPMTRSSPPRLAPLGVLLWWAATSSAMPFHTIAGAPYEADGPDAHELSPRPVGRGAHLGLERRLGLETCANDQCCKKELAPNNNFNAELTRCEQITYGDADKNCNQFRYKSGAPPRPTPPGPRMHTRCAAAPCARRSRAPRAMPRREE